MITHPNNSCKQNYETLVIIMKHSNSLSWNSSLKKKKSIQINPCLHSQIANAL